jgi:hypothetical protein
VAEERERNVEVLEAPGLPGVGEGATLPGAEPLGGVLGEEQGAEESDAVTSRHS